MKTKILISLAAIFLGVTMVSAQMKEGKTKHAYTKTDVSKTEVVTWDKKVHDFGTVKRNKPVTAVFEIKNNGDVPIIISNVKPSCGCTVADYPKDPIAPGKSAKISSIYNAKAKGKFNKSISVATSASTKKTVLRIKGEVTD